MTTRAVVTAVLDAIAAEYGDDAKAMAVPGQTLVADWAFGLCPVVFVRLDSQFPSAQFPNPAAAATPCASPIVARLHVGVWRCVENLGPDGEPPDADQQTADALAVIDDADRLRTALCTVVADRGLTDPKGVQLGSWAPLGPAGNVAGGYWPVSVRIIR